MSGIDPKREEQDPPLIYQDVQGRPTQVSEDKLDVDGANLRASKAFTTSIMDLPIIHTSLWFCNKFPIH
jgi:hypothetical protein